MTLEEIKKAVDEGKAVKWGNDRYTVTKNKFNGGYYVSCAGGSAIGLTWQDGKTLNGKPEEFYIKTEVNQ